MFMVASVFHQCHLLDGFEFLEAAGPTVTALVPWLLMHTSRKLSGLSLSLFETLDALRPYEATYLQDKVYAALSIGNDYRPGAMPIDYRLDVSSVYLNFQLPKDGKLNLLG